MIAGREYGTGSSRDWAAKGTPLLGIRAVIAESYERIHRSNLVGMGVLPLQFLPGDSAASLGLTGREAYTIIGLADDLTAPARDRGDPLDADGAQRPFGRSPASTDRSRSTTSARAASCLRSCDGWRATDRDPVPETARSPR